MLINGSHDDNERMQLLTAQLQCSCLFTLQLNQKSEKPSITITKSGQTTNTYMGMNVTTIILCL